MPPPDATPASSVRPKPASLAPVLVLSWLNSLGTGAVTIGVFFIADEQYGFTPARNALLGLLLGAIYIPGALGVGPGVRALARRLSWVSTRSAVAAVLALMAATSLIPLIWRAEWAIWAFALAYIPLTGAMWPIIESYISGGRRDADLRHAAGAFNLTWASAIPLAFWGMGPLLEHRPLAVIACLGVVHGICVFVAFWLPREPARHLAARAEPHPEVYDRLLAGFRRLLVLSYVLMAAIAPAMPWKLEGLGVRLAWQTVLVSVWQVSRIGMFVLMRHWHGWHGRLRTPAWTAATLVAGFVVVISAPSVWAICVGLALFGIGLGGIYAGAFYYAMEVGDAEVDAGGKHEALIGAGYTIGPAAALAAWAIVGATGLGESRVAPLIIGFSGLAILAFGVSTARALRPRRGRTQPA
jgi:hypothetical protein